MRKLCCVLVVSSLSCAPPQGTDGSNPITPAAVASPAQPVPSEATPPPPSPREPEDTPDFASQCAPWVKLVTSWQKAAPDIPAEEVMARLEQEPAGPEQQTRTWCRDMMARLLKGATDGEPFAVLDRLGRYVTMAFEQERMPDDPKAPVVHQLCPSAAPVPDTLDKLAPRFVSRQEDWQQEGWACLKFAQPSPQVYQYRIDTLSKQGTVEIVLARKLDEGAIELFLSGKVTSGMLRMDPLVQMRRSP